MYLGKTVPFEAIAEFGSWQIGTTNQIGLNTY